MRSEMKVVLLAGGRGTRLAEETQTLPKPMVEIGGRPLLFHLMRYYAAFGYKEFLVACGYRGEVIKDYFRSLPSHLSDYVVNLADGSLEVVKPAALDWRIGLIDTGAETSTGGRILHHFERRLSLPSTTVMLVGFQAAGTRGRALQDGAKQLRMHGRWVQVAAQVRTLHGLSAHADRTELLHWLSSMRRPPRMTYVVHGEVAPAQAFATLVHERLGWSTHVARDGETVALA